MKQEKTLTLSTISVDLPSLDSTLLNANEHDISPKAAESNAPVSNTQRVYRQLRSLIIAGDIEPGQKLKIDELKVRLKSGASPIREALSLLTSDQLVDRIDQRGFRAAQVSQTHFIEILQLRCQLEEIAIRASIEHGGEGWKASLSHAVVALEQTDRKDALLWEALHKDFHRILISACQSPILLRFCDQLYDLNIRYRNLAARAQAYDQRNVNEEHRQILKAALAGKSKKSGKLLRQHYAHTGDYLADRLAQMGLP